MSKFIFLIQTLLLITFAFTFTNCVNYSSDEDELQIQFSNFIQKYGKVYKSQKEKEYRFNIYKNNYQSIALHNSQLHSTYKKAMNKFGDLTSKEFEKLYKPNKMFLNNSHHRSHHHPINNQTNYCGNYTFQNTSVPNIFDWRNIKGVVSPVKDQQQCGSCWAFSTVEALESFIAINSNTSVTNLSPQELVDCTSSYGNNGCNGGMMDSSFRYVIDKGGICSEDEIKYKGVDKKCKDCKTRYGENDVKNCYNIASGEELTMREVVSRQPISIAIEADTATFQFYSDGVITSVDCGTNLDHAVVIVGYNTKDDIDYWIVRNSWGEFWGNKGYVFIERNNVNNNTNTGICGIAMASVFPSSH